MAVKRLDELSAEKRAVFCDRVIAATGKIKSDAAAIKRLVRLAGSLPDPEEACAAKLREGINARIREAHDGKSRAGYVFFAWRNAGNDFILARGAFEALWEAIEKINDKSERFILARDIARLAEGEEHDCAAGFACRYLFERGNPQEQADLAFDMANQPDMTMLSRMAVRLAFFYAGRLRDQSRKNLIARALKSPNWSFRMMAAKAAAMETALPKRPRDRRPRVSHTRGLRDAGPCQ